MEERITPTELMFAAEVLADTGISSEHLGGLTPRERREVGGLAQFWSSRGRTGGSLGIIVRANPRAAGSHPLERVDGGGA